MIGTSIGAINGAIIAGNSVEARLDRLNAFWRRVEYSPGLAAASRLPVIGALLPNWATIVGGVSKGAGRRATRTGVAPWSTSRGKGTSIPSKALSCT